MVPRGEFRRPEGANMVQRGSMTSFEFHHHFSTEKKC